MFNQVTLIGRLGKEFESHSETSPFAQNSLATTEKYKNKNNEVVKKTQWHNIVVNGKLKELLIGQKMKGKLVFIQGKIAYEEWEDKESKQKKHITKIYVQEFRFLEKKESEQLEYESPEYESEGKVPF